MDPMGYDSSLFWGGKPFFSGNSLKAQFWIPTNFDFDVKSPTEKHTQQIWNWPDLSTTKVSTFEISHGASNSQLSTLKIPERNSKFSVGQQCFHVFRCPSESSIRSRIFPKGDWGGKPSWSTPEENGVFVFFGMKSEDSQIWWNPCMLFYLIVFTVYLYVLVSCGWFFFAINVGEYTIYGSDVSWIQDNKDDQKTCATPDIYLKKMISTDYTNPPLELQTTSLKWMFGETTVF